MVVNALFSHSYWCFDRCWYIILLRVWGYFVISKASSFFYSVFHEKNSYIYTSKSPLDFRFFQNHNVYQLFNSFWLANQIRESRIRWNLWFQFRKIVKRIRFYKERAVELNEIFLHLIFILNLKFIYRLFKKSQPSLIQTILITALIITNKNRNLGIQFEKIFSSLIKKES